MSLISLLMTIQLLCVVDRIEPPWAVVEWQPWGTFSDLPLDWLPPNTREGDRLRIRLRPKRAEVQPDPAGVWTQDGLLHLPPDVPVHKNRLHHLRITR